MRRIVLIAALVAAASAQICCNLQQECDSLGLFCDETTQCYTDPRFLYLCRDDPFGPWVGDGWIREGNYVYKHFESAVQYPEAESACAAHVGQSPGNLAAYVLRQPTVIRTIDELGWVKGGNGQACPWIGYELISGSWRWVDGGSTNPATTEWKQGEPNNAGGRETVVHIWSSDATKILMNDLPTSERKFYICEVKVI